MSPFSGSCVLASQHHLATVDVLVSRRWRARRMNPVHEDNSIVSADQSVIRRVNGQERRSERVPAFRIHRAVVVVGLDEQEKLQSWQRDLPFANGGEETVQSAASPVSRLRRL